MVYSDETRPLLQGSRLTAWELLEDNIPVTTITDNMAAWSMKTKGINIVITGADRIAANGDTANKIGTYGVALAAKAHGIPFYIAAPASTFDLRTAPALQQIYQRIKNESTQGGTLYMESMIRDISLAESGQKKIDWVKGHMPLLNYFNEKYAPTQLFKGINMVVTMR